MDEEEEEVDPIAVACDRLTDANGKMDDTITPLIQSVIKVI